MQTGNLKKLLKHKCALPHISSIIITFPLQTTAPLMRSIDCFVCCCSTSPSPCRPWLRTPTLSSAESTEVHCLTVISPEGALHCMLMAICLELPAADNRHFAMKCLTIIRISVYHIFQNECPILQKSMLLNEKHISVKSRLFTDNLSWCARLQLLLACGPLSQSVCLWVWIARLWAADSWCLSKQAAAFVSDYLTFLYFPLACLT